MKTRVALAISSCLLTSLFAVHAGPPPGYQLKWSDEFNGNTLNTDYWNIETGRRDSAVKTAAAVSVTNGCLVLTTYTENKTNYTAYIDTRKKVLNGYGYYEASIQFSNTHGNWSAFWLNSPYINRTNSLNNPTNGVEIDIFEHRQGDGNGHNWVDGGDHALHWNGYAKGLHKSSEFSNRKLGVASGFHAYGLLWTTNSYTFFVDGRPTWTTNFLVSSVDEYVLLTSEVRDHSWAGDIPKGGYPHLAGSNIKMLVDYVRYYAPPEK
jgi:beta-glucanase (GH16 family)